MAQRFYSKNNVYSLEDLIQVASLSVIKAYRKYDPARSAWSTFMYYVVFNDLVKAVRDKHKAKRKSLRSQSKFKAISSRDEETLYPEDLFYNLKPIETEIVKMHIDGYSVKDIKEKLNITNSQYRTIINHIRRKYIQHD